MPARAKILLGKYKGNIPEGSRSRYNYERYKFFLNAPFNVSHNCCNVMKKRPAHLYSKKTGQKAILGTMAIESKLRTQKWLENGCNGFDLKNPISTPIAFWTEQDILQYILDNDLPIAKDYGDIVVDYEKSGFIEGQTSLVDYGLTDNEKPILKTTGCDRTGCMFCGFGCHLEKGVGRFERIKQNYPKIYEYIMKPTEQGGLNYKEVIDWINENGNFNIKY